MLSCGPKGRRFESRTSDLTLQESYPWSQERLSKCLGQTGVYLLDHPSPHTRKDRVISQRGGILAYIHESITSKLIFSMSSSNCGGLIIECPQLKMFVSLIYRPPKCPLSDFKTVTNKFDEIFTEYERRNEGWIIQSLGDYNFPDVNDWE